MKIYTVYEGEIHSLEVRETEKGYVTIRGRSELPFHCSMRFNKSDNWPLNGEEAVKKHLKGQKKIRISLANRLSRINTEIHKWEEWKV